MKRPLESLTETIPQNMYQGLIKYSVHVNFANSMRKFIKPLLYNSVHKRTQKANFPWQVVIASMRQLVRLKEGKTAKITDIPGFLTQCMQSKVRNTCLRLHICFPGQTESQHPDAHFHR